MNTAVDMPGAIYVGLLFVGHALLWALKRRCQTLATGIDPDVFSQRQSDPLQGYISGLSRILQVYVAGLLVVHALAPTATWGLQRLPLLSRPGVDELGLLFGVAGLALCWYAQRTMAASWRVGIDETNPTELVMNGPFRLIRNPTYSGLFALTLGFWLIWPTWAVLTFAVLFVVMLEVQVRCEEKHLLRQHGETYAQYFARTKRYVPGVY
ncbi:MAG: isoprenylcysteine carboxylmethyltransferase family protein [Actinobacteria bacterium HGW-Actinobacteria-9]|jgi:protein-S-isoprenylcysteine O-methyltransferase Ste14|nr:MAG: isoprenylcysteine carboxylmethyltransferase family protein [Actinobacteria bacterium HGW-Actinobacteria-9]